MGKMVFAKEWQEFRDSGLFWWINMILHTFGWALVVEIDNESKEIINAYPARVKFRGFAEKSNTDGYQKVSEYLSENISEIKKEAFE